MSRPQAWNGTAWVDPAFHVGGGVYKTYAPPVYDVPVSQYGFAAGAEGWRNRSDGPDLQWSASDGGYIFCDSSLPHSLAGIRMGDAGYYGNHPPSASRPLDPTKQIRQEVVWRAVPLGGTYPPDDDFAMLFGFTWDGGMLAPQHSEVVGGLPQGVDTGWQTYRSQLITPGRSEGYLTQWIEPGEGYLDNFGRWHIMVSSARMLYDNDQPVHALGDPGWEPKVYRGNGVWK